jgi:hypothetical protein
MRTNLEIIGVFLVLGVYIFGLLRWWYRHLKSLAERYDIPERRKRAGRWYPVLVLIFVPPVLITFIWFIRMAPASKYLVCVAMICSLVPGFIWWIRKMPGLAALGYGRQPRS